MELYIAEYMSIQRLIYQWGEQRRNPNLRGHFFNLKNSEKWPLDKLKEYQLEQLKVLIQHAWDTVPYYREKWEAANFHPKHINNLSDIAQIPILTKEELLNFPDRVHSSKKFTKTFKAVTSGTSGMPLKFDREESADSFNRAAIKRGYSWYSVEPWELNGYFWGFSFNAVSRLKTKLLDSLQNRFRLFSYNKKGLEKFCEKLQKASYVHGYSSMIYQTAKLILENKLPRPKRLKMVKGTSEKIYESYKSVIQEAFGQPIRSEYGATETGIIAFECPYGNMHINMEGVLVEEIDHKIVVTNLQMLKFPIIRYELGDYIELARENKECACGMQHSILNEVTGRVGQTIIGHKNEYPSLYFYYIFKNLSSSNQLNLTYFIEQKKVGELEFFILEDLTEKETGLLSKEIQKYFKNDMSFEIKKLDKEKKKGKTKSFISYL